MATLAHVGMMSAALFATLVPLGWALFEDEIGQYEWQVSHVGQPVALAYSADAADRVLVASASGVVASVLLKDGTMQWRRVASQDPMKVLRARGKGIVSATERGLVQGWKSISGDLAWQRKYSDPLVDVLLVGTSTKQSAVVVRSNEMEARSMAGKLEWTAQASSISQAARFWAAATTEDEANICAVVTGDGTKAVQIESDGGKVAKEANLPSSVDQALASGSYMVVDSHLVVLVGDTLSSHALCGEGGGDTYELTKVKSSTTAPFKLMPWQRTAGVFAVSSGATTAIFGLGPKGLKHLRTFDGQAVVGPVFSVHDDEGGQPVAVAMIKERGIQIQLLDPASGNVQPAIHAEGFTAADHGSARLLLVRELSSGEHRTVLTAADHSIAGVQGTKVVWSREEALASIRHAFFYGRPQKFELPTAVDKDPVSAMVTQLTELPMQIVELIKQPLYVASSIQEVFSSVPKKNRQGSLITMMPSTKVPTSGDELKRFGADKLIIAATRASKIFALEATSSEIIWQKYLGSDEVQDPACARATVNESSAIGFCNIWTQLLAPSAVISSELLVVVPAQGDRTRGQQVLWLNPLNGVVLHSESAPKGAPIMSVSELPRRSGRRQQVHPILIVDEERKAYTLPGDSSEAAQLLQDSADRLFHYEVDRAQSVVQGYVIGGPSSGSNSMFPLWNLELGSVGEKIVASTTPLHREWERVPVYIKGDASILYKYLNTNLLAVASVDTLHKGNVSSLNLYAVDAITGHVLHQSRILGGSAPVHMVACDNWILTHYWNSKKIRFEVTIVELFQAKSDDGPWNILFGPSVVNQTKSAHYLDSPVPLQQTYIFPTGVTSLGVTATLKGITPRSIIMALTTDHIFRVSKDQLNPRRPYATGVKENILPQFAPTKEEALPPYAPVMPVRQTDVLSHYLPMSQVTGIVSSPTALESTSLVFSYGLDLFFTPVQTAKAYDVLSPGFNYKLLYASVSVVLVVFLATSYLAQYKTLQERWK